MSKKIKIYRSRIEISPYYKGESQTLERKLEIFDYLNRTVSMRLYRIVGDKLYVPKGLSVEEIEKCIVNDGIVEYEKEYLGDEVRPGRDIELNMRPGVGARDDHQIKAISFLVSSDTNAQKFLNIDTGYGKTFCAIKSISILGKATMIIMANSNLMKQWQEALKNFTYINESDIRIVSGRDSVEKTYREKEKGMIYICSTQTMAILSEEDKLQEFVEKNGIGIKIIDEAHEMMNAVSMIENGCDVFHNFYLTATPERSDTREDILYLRITKTFQRFGGYTSDLLKYVHVKNVHINTYPSPWHIRVCQTKNGFSAILYEKFVFKSDRKKTFFYLICKFICLRILRQDPDAKILIILSIRESINEIARLFKFNDNIKCGVFTNDSKNKAVQLNRNIILSTLKSSGAGMDIKNLRCIINFVPFKSPVLLHQLMGRLRYMPGKALFYFNIIDEGYDNIVKQNFQRQLFFRQKAADISDMKLNINLLVNKCYETKDRKEKEEDPEYDY